MKLILTVLGLLLVVEGLPYFAFPEKMQAMMKEIEKLPPDALRILGFVSTLLGLAICYVTQRTHFFS